MAVKHLTDRLDCGRGLSRGCPGGRDQVPVRRSRGSEGRERGKWRSRPLSRVLSWTVIPLAPASPLGSSNQPGCGTSHAIAPLFGLAPGGVCRAPRRCPLGRWALTPPFRPYHAPLRAVRRFVFCCTFRRLTPPRRYLAPCSVEPGLSSAHCCDATVLAGSAVADCLTAKERVKRNEKRVGARFRSRESGRNGRGLRVC
jgi:hypothetical protein